MCACACIYHNMLHVQIELLQPRGSAELGAESESESAESESAESESAEWA